MEVFRLTDLTFVTAPDEPADVLVDMRPPETNEDVLGRSENSFVAEMIVRVLDDR